MGPWVLYGKRSDGSYLFVRVGDLASGRVELVVVGAEVFEAIRNGQADTARLVDAVPAVPQVLN